MLEIEQIRARFGADKNHFALMDYLLSNGCEILYAETDGVLCFYYGIHAIFGTSENGLKNCLSLIDNASCVVCSSSEEGDATLEKFKNLSKKKACYQILYEKSFGTTLPDNTVVEVLKPTEENVDFVTKTYTLGFSKDEIKRLMTRFDFYATYTDGEISGYIGRHDEGSIGILEIMPKFRRRGLGAYLVDYSIKKLLEKGEIAYCNIETQNKKSLKMHEKMGYYPSDKLVYWCV
ncbi:MAG: GNAT family N-acetyltransferase [Clostridia bacterium]|nr:GNAT family N-acetyltransferase [Clostridia bacterium]